jgi:hypothetical protein
MTINACRSAMGWPAKREQKVLQVYTVDIYKKEGTTVPKKRDLVTDDST